MGNPAPIKVIIYEHCLIPDELIIQETGIYLIQSPYVIFINIYK